MSSLFSLPLNCTSLSSHATTSITTTMSPSSTQTPLIDYIFDRFVFEPNQSLCSVQAQAQLIQLKGLKVSTTCVGIYEEFIIHKISKNSAASSVFDVKGIGQISVQDYYLSAYGFRLKYPYYPLVVRKKDGKSLLYPFEKLFVCGHVENEDDEHADEHEDSMDTSVQSNASTPHQGLCEEPSNTASDVTPPSEKVNHALKEKRKVIPETPLLQFVIFNDSTRTLCDEPIRPEHIEVLHFAFYELDYKTCKIYAEQLIQRAKDYHFNIVFHEYCELKKSDVSSAKKLTQYFLSKKDLEANFFIILGNAEDLIVSLKTVRRVVKLPVLYVLPKWVQRPSENGLDFMLRKINQALPRFN